MQLQITHTLVGDGFVLNTLSPRVATITNPEQADFRVAYFGFESHDAAFNFFKHITDNCLASRAKVREAERINKCAYEVKVWGMSKRLIGKLALKDLVRVEETKAPLPIPRCWEKIRSFDAIAHEAA